MVLRSYSVVGRGSSLFTLLLQNSPILVFPFTVFPKFLNCAVTQFAFKTKKSKQLLTWNQVKASSLFRFSQQADTVISLTGSRRFFLSDFPSECVTLCRLVKPENQQLSMNLFTNIAMPVPTVYMKTYKTIYNKLTRPDLSAFCMEIVLSVLMCVCTHCNSWSCWCTRSHTDAGKSVNINSLNIEMGRNIFLLVYL